MQMETDLNLHNLAELKMNETLLGKKEFTNTTENDPDTGKFEIDGYEEFKYKVEIKKMEFPDFSGLMGKQEDDQEAEGQASKIQKLIFEKLKINIEEMLWQVSVTITSPENSIYTLDSWIKKDNPKLDVNFTF